MADLTHAVEVAAKVIYDEEYEYFERTNYAFYKDWGLEVRVFKLECERSALPIVTALHDAGLLKEKTNG